MHKEGILLLVLGLCSKNRKKESDAKQAHGEDTNFKSAAGSKTKRDGHFRVHKENRHQDLGPERFEQQENDTRAD
jgi:hypothetical protein